MGQIPLQLHIIGDFSTESSDGTAIYYRVLYDQVFPVWQVLLNTEDLSKASVL